jgi:hypothetical protein
MANGGENPAIAHEAYLTGRERMQEFVSAFTQPARTVLGRQKQQPYQGSRRLAPDVVRAEAEQMTDMLNHGYSFDTATQTWRNPNAPEGAKVLDAREDLKMVFRNLEQGGRLPDKANKIMGSLAVPSEQKIFSGDMYQELMVREYGPILGKLKM